jgi:predicted MFS family arabinose efflux permease
MEKSDDTPLWVYLAFSNIKTRKGALLLLWVCLIFSIYSIPWVLLFADSDWVATIFLIDDWSWVTMMVPIMLWYWLSLRWVDRNSGWSNPS